MCHIMCARPAISDEGFIFIPFPSTKCHVIDVDWGKLIYLGYKRQTNSIFGFEYLLQNGAHTLEPHNIDVSPRT